jgi:hypothetical protein
MQGDDKQQQISDKISMTLSVFIALCVVSIFCALSIVIVENIDNLSRHNSSKRVNLPHARDFTDILL